MSRPSSVVDSRSRRNSHVSVRDGGRSRRNSTASVRTHRGDRPPPIPDISTMPQPRQRTTSQKSRRSVHHKEGGPLPNMPHELLARATVLWDWDGTIPNRRTKGASVKEGSWVDICNVVDAGWYQIHQGNSCKYIPRAFLEVAGVYDKRFQSRFRVPAGQDLKYIDAKTPPPPPPAPPPPPKQGLFSCCGAKPAAPQKPSRGPRPEIPSPPFPKEPYAAENQGSQIKIAVNAKKPQPQEIVLAFNLTISAASGSRFTGLTFDAMLPPGYTVAGVDPENYNGIPTEIHEKLSQGEDRRRSVAGPAGVPGRPKSIRRRTIVEHDVEFTRFTKSTIKGGGVDTNHANWVAAEDVGSKSGLQESFEFKILLRANSLPPTIKYMFTLESEAIGSSEKPVAKSWKSEWVEEKLP